MEKTPTDELTNLPLLLVPHEDIPAYIDDPRFNQLCREQGEDFADWNHAFHPRRDSLLRGLGGQAIRDSRGQLVLREEHNDYHAAYIGPELPKTDRQRFYTSVLCAAGYVPPEGIEFSNGSPRIVPLSLEQRERLQTSGEVRMMAAHSVRKFMQHHVLGQDVDHIKEAMIGEFLDLDPMRHPEVKARQHHLAHALLYLVADRAAEPLDATYTQGFEGGLIREGMPQRPRDFVHNEITGHNHRNLRQLIQVMRTRFAQAVRLEEPVAA